MTWLGWVQVPFDKKVTEVLSPGPLVTNLVTILICCLYFIFFHSLFSFKMFLLHIVRLGNCCDVRPVSFSF